MNRGHIISAHQPFADALLVGDDNDVRGPFPQLLDSERRSWQPFKMPPAPYVVADNLSIDNPVPIKKETPLAASPLGNDSLNGSLACGTIIAAEPRKAHVRHVRRSRE